MTTATRSPFYDRAVRDFTAAGVPADLIEQIAPGPAWSSRGTPPVPGCAAPRGPESAGVLGSFNLREWFERAPEAWGPDTTPEIIDRAQAAAELLRTVGEGSRVLWTLVAHGPAEWLTRPRWALTVDALTQCGPRLSPADLTAAADLLQPAWSWTGEFGWRRQDSDPGVPAHTEMQKHGASVFSTRWDWCP